MPVSDSEAPMRIGAWAGAGPDVPSTARAAATTHAGRVREMSVMSSLLVVRSTIGRARRNGILW